MTRKFLWLFLAACAFGQTSGNRINVVPFTASPTFDLSLGQVQKMTLTGNVTSSFFANGQPGQTFTVIVCQDATGGRTFAWPTSTQGAATVTASANGCTSQPFSYDGLTYQAAASAGGAGSFPVTSAQNVNTGGSIAPATGIGQIAATQDWWTVAPLAPAVNAWTNTGGSLNSTHGYSFKVRFNSATGGITGAELQATPIAPCASTNCTVTLNTITLPSGYTSYTVGMVDCGSGSCAGGELILASCTNLLSGTACTATTTGSGALPTANTAYLQPSPLGTSTCSPATNPTLFSFDGTNYYPYMGIDSANTGANPPAPYNKISICRPVWENDAGSDPPGGRNAAHLISHLQNGTVTNIANQDRGLYIGTFNCVPDGNCSDSTTHYGLEGIQVVQDINGTPTINGSPDGEVTAGSFQLGDYHTGSLTSPNSFGVNGIRISAFREAGAGSWTSGIGLSALNAQAQNISLATGSGSTMQSINTHCDEASGAPVSINCVALNIPKGIGNFTFYWGEFIGDAGSGGAAFNLESQTGASGQGKTYIDGFLGANHITTTGPNRAVVNPTCSSTGTGTGPSCSVDAGSNDASGTITVTAGTTPTATGTITLTYQATFGSNSTTCVMMASNAGTGSWNARVSLIGGTMNTASAVVNWDNNAVNLTAASTYKVNYNCWGK